MCVQLEGYRNMKYLLCVFWNPHLMLASVKASSALFGPQCCSFQIIWNLSIRVFSGLALPADAENTEQKTPFTSSWFWDLNSLFGDCFKPSCVTVCLIIHYLWCDKYRTHIFFCVIWVLNVMISQPELSSGYLKEGNKEKNNSTHFYLFMDLCKSSVTNQCNRTWKFPCQLSLTLLLLWTVCQPLKHQSAFVACRTKATINYLVYSHDNRTLFFLAST